MRQPVQLELFPTDLRLTRIEPEHNMRRSYRVFLQPDLFGGCSLIREWGRIGNHGGQSRTDRYPNEGHAVDALLALASLKMRRGYVGRA